MSKHHSYGVVETVVGEIVEDNPASQSGVTNGIWAPFDGVQGTGYNLSPEVQKLIVQGRPVAKEGEIDEIPVTMKFGQYTPDIDGMIANLATWFRADGSNVLAIIEEFGTTQFSMRCRTNKVGINGMEKVIEYPKIQIAGMNRSANQREFGPNEYTTSAFFTDAYYPVYKNGVKIYRQVPVFEYLQPVGSPLYTRSATAPTVTSVNGDSSGDLTVATLTPTLTLLFSIFMNLNSVNDLTVTLTLDGTPVPITCVPVITGGDAYKSFTINPVSALVEDTYVLNVSTVVRSRDGVKLATAFTKDIVVNVP